MEKDNARNPARLSGSVARLVSLEEVVLQSWSASFGGSDFDWPQLNGETEVDASTEADHLYDADTGRLLVRVNLEVRGKQSQGHVIQVKCAFLLRYTLPAEEEVTEEGLFCFRELNAMVNAWPFLRETVYASTSRMGLPPLMLPVFRAHSAISGVAERLGTEFPMDDDSPV